MSARVLTLGNMKKVVAKREKEVTDPPDLGPDQMRLYSYYKPGLVAGEYSITAEQHITSPSQWGVQDLVVKNVSIGSGTGDSVPQRFEVVVPHFTLDPAIINSYYPPDGHQDEGRILPHIVFNDPHYPWEILAGTAKRLEGPIDDHNYSYVPPKATNPVIQKVFRNLVPWLALVVFDPEELHFDNVKDVSALGITGYSDPVDLQKQDPRGTFRMQPKDYFTIPASSRVNFEAGYSTTPQGQADFTKLKSTPASMDVIFPKKALFSSLFGGQVSNITPTDPTGTPMSVLESQKYMAHVRHINTIGFPDAGVEEEGLFSIVVSSRTGKVDIDQPQTQICHLVSIEHVDATLGDWIEKQTPQVSDRIGLVSLFSWLYSALPPNPVNFVDTIRNLVNNQQMLNVDQQIFNQIDTSRESSKIIAERLKKGYTLSRWRAQSGEETAAFNRGPLVPGPVPHPIVGGLPDCSETAQAYQILDPQSGLMDLSYSSAWQLGKVLAISDTSFSSALMRFRSIVHNTSFDQAQMLLSSLKPKAAAVGSIKGVMDTLQTMSTTSTIGGDPDRFRASAPRNVAIEDPQMKSVLKAAKQDAATKNASAGDEVFNEFNSAQGNNTDWAIIHTWLCEKLSLGGIPPQYLLPEPSFLPPESLRFFHIDDFWLDCFIDGALSVANHLESDDDVTRRQIKEIFNQYLGNSVPRAGYKPQIPSGGFLIRSKLIKAMPDLRITVTWKKLSGAKDGDDQRASVCRWTKWDDETLMALLDRHTEELDSIVLAQPPHQQRFSLGSYVKKGHQKDSTDTDLVQFDLRRLYTSNAHPIDKEWPEKSWPTKGKDGSDWTQRPTSWLNFSTRVLRVGQMAQDLNDALQFSDATTGEAYNDLIPNSCVLGMELNDPSYYFKITPPPPNDFQPTTDTQRTRKLYVKSTQNVALATAVENAVQSIRSRPLNNLISPTIPKMSMTLSQRQLKAAVLTKATSTLEGKKTPSIQTRIQPLLAAPRASSFAFNNGPLTTTSKFQLKGVYPDYKTTPTRFPGDKYHPDDYIPSKNIYLFDLVFSIQKPTVSEQDLLWIDIDIPLRTDPPDKVKEALLDSNYTGPGLRMLSNQRFIPFLFYDETKEVGNKADNLHVELRPRSATDGFSIRLNDKKTSEISFRLAEAPISKLQVLTNVNVDGTSVSRGRVVINMTEWYKTPNYPGGEPVRSTYVLLKRAATDDKDWDPFG